MSKALVKKGLELCKDDYDVDFDTKSKQIYKTLYFLFKLIYHFF
jgi:hypothetical protein